MLLFLLFLVSVWKTIIDSLDQKQIYGMLGNFFSDDWRHRRELYRAPFRAHGIESQTGVSHHREMGAELARGEEVARKLRKYHINISLKIVKTAFLHPGICWHLGQKYWIDHAFGTKIPEKEGVDYVRSEKALQYDKDQREQAKNHCRILCTHCFHHSRKHYCCNRWRILFHLQKCLPRKQRLIQGLRDALRGGAQSGGILRSVECQFREETLWTGSWPRTLPVSGKIFRKDCIELHPIPYLSKFHSDGYFWPDLPRRNSWSVSRSFHRTIARNWGFLGMFEEQGVRERMAGSRAAGETALKPCIWSQIRRAHHRLLQKTFASN